MRSLFVKPALFAKARSWLIVIFIASLLGGYAPLGFLVTQHKGTELFYEKEFDTFGKLSQTGGLVRASGIGSIIGSIDYNDSSYAEFNFQFFPQLIEKAQNPRLIIKGTLAAQIPNMNVKPPLNQTIWMIDDFGDYIREIRTNPSLSHLVRDLGNSSISSSNNGSILTMTAPMTLRRDAYVLWADLPSIIVSNGSQYLVTKFRSSNRTAFFSAWDSGECIAWVSAQNSGGKWLNRALRIPEGSRVDHVAIGISDEGYPQVCGNQTVEFDYIAIASDISVGARSVKIVLNDEIIFHEELTSLSDGMLTLASILDEELRLRVDLRLLKVDNNLRIIVDKNTVWNVSWVFLGFILDSSSSPSS